MVHCVKHILVGGRPLGGVEVRVQIAATPARTGADALLYSDAAGTIPIDNPIFSEDGDGSINFYVDAGDFDLTPVYQGVEFDLADYENISIGGAGSGGGGGDVVDLGSGAIASLGRTGGDGPDDSSQAGWIDHGINPDDGLRSFSPRFTKVP